MRSVKLVTNHVYHVFNRGVDKREIFLNETFYRRFISVLEHYLNFDYSYSVFVQRLQRAKSLERKQEVYASIERKRIDTPVEMISFCLMPNHYHLTLKQLVDKGISWFMHRIGIGYTNFFNIMQDRSGRLFESTFKAVRIEADERLRHLTRYQHINPRTVVKTTEELIDYPWSSLSTYLGKDKFKFVNPDLVINNFKNPADYLDFVLAEVDELEAVRLGDAAIDDDFGWFADYKALQKERREELRRQYFRNQV